MLSIIVAVASNNIIGKNNELLWYIPCDLKRFKSITTGKTIIMGRKTFESLPGILPNRHHVVITKDKNFIVEDESVEIVHDLKSILTKFKSLQEEVFVIGGGQIYKELLPHVNKLYLTKLNKAYEGDTYFPEIDLSQWKEIENVSVPKINSNSISFSFITLERINDTNSLTYCNPDKNNTTNN